MEKFVVWPDGGKAKAQQVEAANMPEAIEKAEALFGVETDAVNVIEAGRVAEAEHYGVAHAL